MSERETKLRELKETAHALYQRGRYAQCAETYSQLAKLLPHDANVRVRLAEACRRAGQRAQAIAAYRDAATILMLLGCASRARGALKAALELDPRDPVLQGEVVRLGQGEVITTALEEEQLYASASDFFDRLPPTPPPGHIRSLPPPPPPAFVLNAALESGPSGGLPVAPPITPMTVSGNRSAAPARMPALGSGPGREALLPHHRPAAPVATRAPESATERLARSIAHVAAGDHMGSKAQAPGSAPVATPVMASSGPVPHGAPAVRAPVPHGSTVLGTAPTMIRAPGPVPHAAPVQGGPSGLATARTPAVGPVPHGAPSQGGSSSAHAARAPAFGPGPHGSPSQGGPASSNVVRAPNPGPVPHVAPSQGTAPAMARSPNPGPVPHIAPVSTQPSATGGVAPPSASSHAAPQKALPGALLALPALPRTSAEAFAPTALKPVSKAELPPERPTVKVIALLNRSPEAMPTPPPPAPLPRSQVGHPHASSLTMPPLATLPYRPEMRRLAPNVVALRVSPQARWVIIRSDSDLQVSRSEALPGDATASP